MNFILEQLSALPDWLAVLSISAMPVLEIRGALPVALALDFGFSSAYLLSVLGNAIPATILVFALEEIADFVSRHSAWGKKFFVWWFQKTRNKFQKHYDVYGALALFCLLQFRYQSQGFGRLVWQQYYLG